MAPRDSGISPRGGRTAKRKPSGNGGGNGGKRPARRKSSSGRRPLVWLATIAAWGIIGVVGLLGYAALTLPDISALDTITKRPSVVIRSEDGTLIANYGDLYGEYLSYEDFPSAMIQALLATEDRRFFHHFGVDLQGLARAMAKNFMAGKVVEGGSTLTQQLAKNLFLSPDRTLHRKLQEVLLALWLEGRFTKEQIIAIYLNRVYLGAGTYGVDAAAKRYFGKSARDLDLMESAILVGLLKAPSRYSPTNNPELAQARAQQVLLNMQDAGYLSEELSKRMAEEPTQKLKHPTGGRNVYYFSDWIMDQLPDYVGRVEQDITVITTLDTKMQQNAERSLEATLLQQGEALHVQQGALIAMSPDGAIRAMTGGLSYRESQFNRSTQALRQPGSSFKLFPYLALLEMGATPDDIWEDQPITIGKWHPGNYTGAYRGPVTLEEALAESLNTVAVQVSESAGRQNVINLARRMGWSHDIMPTPSLALGPNGGTLLELTTAYAHLANGGRSVVPYGILEIRITDPTASTLTESDEPKIYRRIESAQAPILSGNTVRSMNRMLGAVIDRGTGSGARLPGRPAAGKTGTSQDYRDAWFIGYTANLVAGVWVGNDDNSPMKKVTGGKIPAPIWRDFMLAATADMPVRGLEEQIYNAPGEDLPWNGDGEPQNLNVPAQQQGPAAPTLWDYFFSEQPPAPVQMEGSPAPVENGDPQPLQKKKPSLGGFELPVPDGPVEYEYPKPRKN